MNHKHTTCIPRAFHVWNDVETTVSTSFQRGKHMGRLGKMGCWKRMLFQMISKKFLKSIKLFSLFTYDFIFRVHFLTFVLELNFTSLSGNFQFPDLFGTLLKMIFFSNDFRHYLWSSSALLFHKIDLPKKKIQEPTYDYIHVNSSSSLKFCSLN